MAKVTTNFGGQRMTNFRPNEIGWCEGEWRDIDPLLGTMRDCDIQKRFKKYSGSTISCRRRKFNIKLFRAPPNEIERLAKNAYERKKRYEKLHPGRELNKLLKAWRVGNREDLASFKRLLNCE